MTLRDAIARLKELEAKATPGEWIAWQDPLDKTWRMDHKLPNNSIIVGIIGRENNAQLIRAARNTLPRLIAQVERMEAALFVLRRDSEELISTHGEAIRADYGNTNIACLEEKIVSADEALNGMDEGD